MPKHPFRATLALVVAMAAALGLARPAAADAVADIKHAGAINIGVFEDFPPFSSVGSDLSLRGYDINVANAVAKTLGVKLNLVPVTGQNRIPALQSHKVDILLSVGYSDERAKVIDRGGRENSDRSLSGFSA